MRNVARFATSSLLISVASTQVVQWDIQRRGSPVPRLNRRADGSVQEDIINQRMRGGYFASCSVGTPPQNVTLQLDTGSSDIWVPASSSSICEESQDGCTLGSYDFGSSSTGKVLNSDFRISYVDTSYSQGDYITDTFGIGDVSLQNMTMGLGLDTDIAYGLVGVGYALNEASVSRSHELYNNLPIVMRNEGHIATNAYSLWLNDLDASKGNILFGGVDTTMKLTSLEAHSSSGDDSLSSTSFPISVVLDSGTTFSYLPQDLAEEVWQEVGAEYTVVSNNGAGVPLISCDLANSNGFFSFGFGGDGGPVIKVGMDELVIPSGTLNGRQVCQFGIQNFSGDPFLLGDTFLRSAYVVYDLENNEIGLAPTDFNATTSKVVAFPSQGAKIPSSTPAPSQDAANSGPSSSPDFSASKGFKDLSSSGSGSGSGDGVDSAGSLPPALDFTQLIVMGASMGLVMFGGGMFLLF
ncbi:hypothetical protein EKO27_g3989 [Xylaria grammica]|uniref:Probable aspartic-type endopeptidase OPSB n=1 Tax=Xylaria grammica TaxID=363999 RepID=A0A439D9P6_9PEZI|nr:hypothetical protein EKO27_g3989 [Xylaria grammica]